MAAQDRRTRSATRGHDATDAPPPAALPRPAASPPPRDTAFIAVHVASMHTLCVGNVGCGKISSLSIV